MTTKQAIRKVLTSTSQFIIGDYNGQKWYCPDGFIATVDDIYAQYKPKKSQAFDVDAFRRNEARQPKMATIIERSGDYKPVQSTVDMPELGQTMLVNEQMSVQVNTQYLQLMQALYPTGKIYIDTAYKYSPVRIVVRNYTAGDLHKIVALIMPLKG